MTGRRPSGRVGVAIGFGLLGGATLLQMVGGLARGENALPVVGLLFLWVALGLIRRSWHARWLAVVCLLAIAGLAVRGDLQVDWMEALATGQEQRNAVTLLNVFVLAGCAWGLRVLLRRDDPRHSADT